MATFSICAGARAIAAAVVLALCGVLSISACAAADDLEQQEEVVTTSMAAAVSRDEWIATSRALATSLFLQQRADGSLRDAFSEDGSSRYGDAIAGYALLQTGQRDGNRELVGAALRALDSATRGGVKRWNPTRCFELWGVAAAYNVARTRLRHMPAARASMERWAIWLRQQPTTFLQLQEVKNGRVSNKALVDAVAVLEAQRTGITGGSTGAVLGSGRALARQRAVRLVTQQVPASVRGRNYVLSDAPNFPVSYLTLSYAAYARAVELLGPDAGSAAPAVLTALGRTASAATAPDGEIGYWGRSLSQAWTLSSMAYGLARTARTRGVSAVERPRLVATAHRALRRLQGYGAGPRAEWTTPSLRARFELARRSLDGYARSTEYTGLALLHLNLAIPLLPKSGPLGQVAADGQTRAVIGQGNGRFAVVRRGDVWLAARQNGGSNLRYDIGPVAVKRYVGGVWRDVTPLRPPGNGSGGPVLLRDGQRGMPVGERISVERDGTIAIAGSLRTSDGQVLRDDMTLRVAPTGCGVRYTVDAQAGERFELSAFLRGERDPDQLGLRTDPAPRSFPLAWEGALERSQLLAGLASASDARVSRATLTLRAESDGPVGVTIC